MTNLTGTPLRRLLIGLGLLTLFHSAVAVVITINSSQEHDVVVDLMASLVIGWSFSGTGLFAWWRRPGNLVGPLMFVTGFFFFYNVYTLSNFTPLFVAGFLLGSITYGCLIHLMLVFPDGKLETRLERAVVIGGYFAVIVLQFIGALLIDPARNGCDGCPDNPLLIAQNQDFFAVHNAIQSLFAIAVLVGLVVALVRRWRRWPRSRRMQFAPVLWAGGVSLTLVSLQLAVEVAGAPDGVRQGIFFASLFPFALIPFAFLAGLLRSRISRAEAVGDLVGGLAADAHGGGLREGIAEALIDRSVELAYWVPETGGYVDASGVRAELPPEGAARVATEVKHDGRLVGAIIHDGRLDDSEDLVAQVASAAGLRMENERLDAELRANMAELRASRARIVAAGYEERRRVERDLHDGAQQRLVALSLSLRLARTKLKQDPAEADELLEAAAAELEAATSELRELARGIHPAILSDRGLVAALEALAGRVPLPVEISPELDTRPPTDVEAAAYFVVAEGLTNVARHAGGSGATVRVKGDNGTLLVEVSDDGVGGADPESSGLRGLADRVAALDGTLVVVSPPGGGTTLTASIPCPPSDGSDPG